MSTLRRKSGRAADTKSSDPDPQGGQMSYGSWINELSTSFFLTVHTAASVT
jgi:hypothetical protein